MIPKWFVQELKLIDPHLFVVFNQEDRYYEVKTNMEFNRVVDIPGLVTKSKADGNILNPDQLLKISMKNPTIAVFRELDSRALEELRFRRWKFLQKFRKPSDDIKEIIERNREAKKKKAELSAEMMAEGFMKMDKMEKSKMFDLGENHA